MGNCFEKKKENERKLVSFSAAVDNFVSGGDLLFIEETSFYDGYTKLNTQVLHALKKALRLKQSMDMFGTVKQWCRVAIVIDSDVEEIKYLLELTPEGFIKTEYLSRVLEFKANNQVFAIKRL